MNRLLSTCMMPALSLLFVGCGSASDHELSDPELPFESFVASTEDPCASFDRIGQFYYEQYVGWVSIATQRATDLMASLSHSSYVRGVMPANAD